MSENTLRLLLIRADRGWHATGLSGASPDRAIIA
jgi:hypothetical protein